MKKFNFNFKSIVQRKARWLLTIIAILTLGVGQMWGGGWFTDGMWQVWGYKTGYGSDGWLATNMGKNSDYNIGVITWDNHTLKGLSVNTYGSDVQYPKVYWHFPDGTESNSQISWSSGSNNKYWESKGLWDYSIDQSTPGDFTIDLYFKLYSGGSEYGEVHRKITWTIPGFTTTSTSKTFSNTTVSSTTDATISFGQHYGTALTTSNCALSGTNSTEFEVRSISETGVTVRFKPSSNGNKSATLTITDAHSKTCTITLSGKTRRVVTYNKGTYGTGGNQTAYKVYGTNLTLADEGYFTRTGYDQTKWNTDASGSGGTSYNLKGTYSTEAAVTLYPTWTAKNYTSSNNIKHENGTTAGQYNVNYDATSISYTTTPSKTGYNIEGLYYESGLSNKIVNSDRSLRTSTSYTTSGGKWNQTSAPNLYVNWEAKTYTITLNKNGADCANNGTATATYDNGSVTNATYPTYTDYRCDGYFTAADGGTKVLNTNGTFVASVTNYTDGSGNWTRDADTELFAHWTYDVTSYTVNFGAGTSYTSFGEVSAYNNNTSSSISTGASVRSGHSITFTASPNTGYEVEGWYTNAACNAGKHDTGQTTYTESITGATNVYVKFKEIEWSVAFAAGTGGTVTTPAATPQTVGQVTGISIAATPSTGYTFNRWTSSDGGSFTSAVTTNSNTFKPTANTTVTASFTETMHTVTKTSCTGSSSVGIATAATVTCSNAPAGKKFDRWSITGTYSITSGSLTSRSITFTATTDVSITATYVDRTYKKVYFAKPSGWTNIYAYTYYSTNASKRNAAYPGIRLDNNVTNTGTETVNCVTYYYYKYYTDNNGEGDDQTSNASLWNKVVFNDNNDSRKTADLTISNGHFYRSASTGSGSTQGYDWYLEGTFNNTSHWNIEDYPIVFDACGTTGSVEVEDLTATAQSFKIYRASTNEWFRYSTASIPLNTVLTLTNSSGDNNTFTPIATTSYRFTLDITSTSSPKLTVGPADDEDHTVTFAVNGHGKITTPGTGEKTIHRYAPTTITAVADPGYRFTGWTKSGTNNAHISIASASSATTTVTADDDVSSATITANFSNDGFVYFDASAVSGFSGGGKVYVTYLQSSALSWDDGEGGTGALIVKNWISDALHNQEMTRIPNTNIYYFYTSTTPQGKILFTSKSHAGSNYKLWEMAAVVREDFNVGQDNMFVAENWVLKDKNKTGYYDGYWMKYNETDPGVKLEIYSMGAGTPRISGSPFSFTRTEEGSRIYTTKVTGLTANTQYGIEILGNNGTYYKNSGEMTSTNAVGGWDYVDRQPTRGTIRTTAAGDYNVQLSCSDKLILAVDFPLAVGDYQVKYSGKDSVGGSTITNASSVIRHIGAVGSKNDTVSFFVVNGDSWTLQLQKCTAVSPSITWTNVDAAKTAANFGTPETGVYNFVVKQDSASGTPVTPSFATMTPIAYTGNYYIRTDAAAGGWEAYKKSMDNRMVFSNYSKQHSNYDHYHCHYSTSGKNVKFCIANDYSGQLSVVKTTDSYVNSDGNLYADANVRFMWNSETNVVRRAYLNGSSTTDFLVLEAKSTTSGSTHTGDSIKNADGTYIDKSGYFNQVKFEDKNNWVYQKEVQALEGTHYRLTSNYRYSGDDHIQYFKGSSGDWTPAHTELLIGGTTGTWQTLRLIYDFKTNHLTAAWLPPTTDITTAKHIEADMLLIRTCQNAAQQLTFTGSGSVADVKTMIGAIELRYDSIVGKVSSFTNTTRAYRELMYYISFPFDVAVSDIYGFGQLNKEWYLQYYDGAERAAKGFFRGDGTTTFWKFMTLSDTLKANVGYSLLLDNDYFNATGTGTVWENMRSGDKIYLYFPSAKELDGSKVIKSGSTTVTLDANEHTSGRTFEVNSRTLNHNFTDSHWNMMGVPLFENKSDMSASFAYADDPSAMPGDGKGYFYEWDSINNELSIRDASTYTFKSMHGYMVQHSGTVTFTGSSIQQASIVARRALKNEENYVLELQLLQNNRRVSRTYIELRDEASDMFALNEDVYMVYTSLPADLFTYAGDYDVSANVLSVQDHTIPVGIEVHKAGAFTFTMPSNFSGTATLVDTETGDRTNLALSDYTVSLPKGVCDGRFYIEINTKKVPTAIDGVEDGSGSLKDGKAHKFIENGQMYILQNGVIYDAQGKRVK